jgi:hypothetical protein
MGEEVIASHGSREMLIWGPIFHQVESDVDRGNVRLENLLKYLESIQAILSQEAPAKGGGGVGQSAVRCTALQAILRRLSWK